MIWKASVWKSTAIPSCGKRNGYRFITGTDSQLVGSARVTVGSWEGMNVLSVEE